jgi:hypothetical protein
MRTQAVVTNVWLYVFNILEKIKNSKWNVFQIMLFLMH